MAKGNEYEYKTTGNDHEQVERYDYSVQISYKADRITFGFDVKKKNKRQFSGCLETKEVLKKDRK